MLNWKFNIQLYLQKYLFSNNCWLLNLLTFFLFKISASVTKNGKIHRCSHQQYNWCIHEGGCVHHFIIGESIPHDRLDLLNVKNINCKIIDSIMFRFDIFFAYWIMKGKQTHVDWCGFKKLISSLHKWIQDKVCQ